MTYQETLETVAAAAATFPAEFGLRAFPGKRFRANAGNSYYSEEYGVLIYTDILRDGVWSAFCKGSPDELRREITP